MMRLQVYRTVQCSLCFHVCMCVPVGIDSEEEKQEEEDYKEDEGAEGEKKAKSSDEKPGEEQEVHVYYEEGHVSYGI